MEVEEGKSGRGWKWRVVWAVAGGEARRKKWE